MFLKLAFPLLAQTLCRNYFLGEHFVTKGLGCAASVTQSPVIRFMVDYINTKWVGC